MLMLSNNITGRVVHFVDPDVGSCVPLLEHQAKILFPCTVQNKTIAAIFLASRKVIKYRRVREK